MIRIHFTAADFAGVRFAPRAAPLLELNTALMKLLTPGDELLYGRWRRRSLHSLPAAAGALADLAPAGRAPGFLDVFDDSLPDALDAARQWHPHRIRSEIERVYAGHPAPPPPWLRDLHRGEAGGWRVLRRAQHAAFESVVRPVWPVVQDLHQREFTRHALAVAEHGLGAALAGLVPGARLRGSVWELPGTGERDVEPGGRGLVLRPTFHWTGHPLVSDLPGRPVHVTFPAGPGLPLTPAGPADRGGPEEALARVLGRTRCEMLLLLAEEHTTSGLARRLGVSDATASAHAAALRGAGLVTTVRAGRAVLHRRTAMGTLLAGRYDPVRGRNMTRDEKWGHKP
ncbi:winged helix-turn-helix domain-containing protein [Streptomyces abikoensis]|uniref:winged helix-turn-helix domain-containing protein n=1 Tax=Streptomyces abikoensis TaxID=97398 RepID=UPI0034008A18